MLSHPYGLTLTFIHNYWKAIALTIQTFTDKVSSLLSRFVITFQPRSKCLLNSWLQSLSTVILEPKKIKSVTAFIFSPSVCHEVMGPYVMILIFWLLSFKLAFSLLFSLPSRGSLVPLCFLPLVWCHLHIWGIDISPGSLDSSLSFIKPGISHDVVCM